MSAFIGRENELEQVRRLLAGTRLLTLIGPGGVGKTRLALRAAASKQEDFPHGVWLVELASLAEPRLVPQAVSAVFGLREDKDQHLKTVLAEYLSTKRLLLLLDNCEHLVDACAGLADTLLKACPNLHILATSREALGVEGETLYPVPSLSVPDPQHILPFSELGQYDAVNLFVERAGRVLPGFDLNPDNAHAIVQICHRLDGIPLAIELAASRINILQADQIAARLDDRFRLLTSTSRTVIPRQRTLQASIDWSYDLLCAEEQALLKRLSVFYGGWTLEAAEAVCADPPTEDSSPTPLRPANILDVLTQLVNKSLVEAGHAPGQPARFRLLETVHQYASDKLAESGEIDALRDRHLAFFMRFTQENNSGVATIRQKTVMQLFRAEFDNLRAALRWAFAGDRQHAESGLRLSIDLVEIWELSGFNIEGMAWLKNGLSRLEEYGRCPDSLRSWGLYALGSLNASQNFLESRQQLEQSIALFRACGDKSGLARALVTLVNLLRLVEPPAGRALVEETIDIARQAGDDQSLAKAHYWLGFLLIGEDDEQARFHVEKALDLFQKTGNAWAAEVPYTALGDIAIRQGDHMTARMYCQAAFDLARELGDQYGTANSLGFLAQVAYLQQDFRQMAEYIQESLVLFRELNNRGSTCWMLRHLAVAAKRLGDLQQGQACLAEGLALSQSIGDRYGIYAAVAGSAGIEAAAGQLDQAARLIGAFEALFDGFPKPLDYVEKLEFESTVELLRQELGEAAYQQICLEGRSTLIGEIFDQGRLSLFL